MSSEPRWIAPRIPAARSIRIPGKLDDVWQQSRARWFRVSSRGPEEHESHELPELDPDCRFERRDRRHRHRACDVGYDARGSIAKAVDDDPAEKAGKDDRNEVEEDREPGQRRAPGGDEHVPGNG